MRDLISVSSGFQHAININYDFGDAEKLKNFIPTKSSLELLEDILLSTNKNSSDRSRILIGAYGKGKSHILLTILSILMKRDLSLFEKLLPKINKDENTKLKQLIENYYESDNKILPVVISGSNVNLTQAFLSSLHRTLLEHDLLNLMPETNYTAAVSTINRWKEEFPETYKKFLSMIDSPINIFIERLETYDTSAYQIFERIYPNLTSGSTFNPFLDFDVIELYESVAKSLKAFGYTGIYVVYDEFSKFLETNIKDASLSDTKMLQDFAEKCCRSGDLQLHLLLISHKEISNYIDQLPKEKTDGWRGISERFKHIHLNDSSNQTYEVMASVIQHNESNWKEFRKSYSEEFQNLLSHYYNHQIFADIKKDEIKAIVEDCFPLHPVSTFILPRLSERVAQNERTLFTFLSADERNTLSSFLDDYENDFKLVTPDLIYDYFEPLFQKELYLEEIHDIYILANTILNQIPNKTLSSKIIKSLALIYILEQFERLSPTKEQLVNIYSDSYSIDEIEKTIDELIEKELIIYLKQSNGYLRLKKSSGIDFRQKIRDQIEIQKGKVSIKDILNTSNFDNYLYPSRYNQNYEMTRYFAFEFISGSEVDENVDWNKKSELFKADGVVYGIIPESETQLQEIIKILENTKSFNRCIFVVPRHYRNIENIILEFAAVKQLIEQVTEDPILLDEYEMVFEDLQEVILNHIQLYTHPENFQSLYFHKGEIVNIYRKSELANLISKICEEAYDKTPIINNEAINKNEITNVTKKSRTKIVGALLRNELEPNLGLTGNGQEVSIMRSTLIRTGILKENNNKVEINLSPSDGRMSHLLKTIEDFISKARKEKRINFSDLYYKLTSPEENFGLRQGVIPIYLAAVIHKHRQEIIINDRFGPVPLNADLLTQINSQPNLYTLEYLDWNPEKEEYVAQLEEAFKDYIIKAEKSENSYDYVAKAIYRWYMDLPKYSKEITKNPIGKELERPQLQMVRFLRRNLSGSELLFKKIPKIFNCNNYLELAKEVILTKEAFDDLLDQLKTFLISETKALFSDSTFGKVGLTPTFTSVVKDWCEKLDPKVFEQLFSDGTDQFLKILTKASNDEDLLITRLARQVTGLRIEDWNSRTIDQYFQNVKKFIKTAKEFRSEIPTQTSENLSSYQITFSDKDGNSTIKRFDQVEISKRGHLLFNQLTDSLDSMGRSISEQEKRQIVMEVLRTLC